MVSRHTSDSISTASFLWNDQGRKTCAADEPAALVFDANGTMLRVSKVKRATVAPYTVLGWKVADLRAGIKELTERGVSFEKFDGLPQDESSVCTFPGGTQVAWFKDPDGNILSLTQFPQ